MPSDTPQHAIRDGEFRIVYVTGNKGLYKYFPDTNQILMFKPAGEGNQGHMAGYAGYGGPAKGIMELVITNYEVGSSAGAPIGARHVPSVGWNLFGDSPATAPGVKRWTSPSANKFDPDEMLFLASETWGLNISEGRIVGSGSACQVLAGPTCDEARIWYSPDGGQTMVPFKNITLNMPASLPDPSPNASNIMFRAHKIRWDHIVDGRWAMLGAFKEMYSETAYSHEDTGLMLIVGDRSGNAHMWLRPTPNILNNTIYGPPNYTSLFTGPVGWDWVDPDPDTGFHKIVIGFQVRAGSGYQYVLAETSIPGPTGTSWTPAYIIPMTADNHSIVKGLAQAYYEPLEHRRGTLEVYHATSNTQTTWTAPMENIGGEVLWQSNYMEPTSGIMGSHWELLMPGTKLGNDIATPVDALYVADRLSSGGGGILRVPYGATTYGEITVVPGTEGRTVGIIAADDQHRTYIACCDGSRYSVQNWFVFDGETWGVVEAFYAPGEGYINAGGVAIINRTPL
jgi:hypothetical protein